MCIFFVSQQPNSCSFWSLSKVQFHKILRLNYNFLFVSFVLNLFIYSFSCFWWATEPFPGLCMHQQTCWYDLKGHVLFTLTEAFWKLWRGVPLKRTALTLLQQTQSFMLRLNWLMVYIKIPFFPFRLAFPGVSHAERGWPIGPTLPLPGVAHWDIKEQSDYRL